MRDLAGQRFGRLVAVAPTGRREGGGVVWLCACDCGRECEVRSDYLVRGRATSCGCGAERKPRSKDLAGKRFGRLVVKGRAGRSAGAGHAVWLCDCDCGNECEATTYALTSGRKRSCGCMRGRPPAAGAHAAGAAGGGAGAAGEAPPAAGCYAVKPGAEPSAAAGAPAAPPTLACGRRFGRLVAVDGPHPGAGGAPAWRCVCDCNRVVRVPAADLLSGAAASCGHCSYDAREGE